MVTANGSLAGNGKTALVLEDESLLRMLMVDALEECGYSVLEAIDGEAGLRLLRSSAAIDLLITDFRLPGDLDGREVAQQARRTRPNLTVLLVSGVPVATVVQSGPMPANAQLLAKPFPMVRLLSTVAQMMREAITSPRVAN